MESEQSARRALQLFLEAARNGDKAALLNIGYFYDKGVGVKRDRTKALYWYKRAYRRIDVVIRALQTILPRSGETNSKRNEHYRGSGKRSKSEMLEVI